MNPENQSRKRRASSRSIQAQSSSSPRTRAHLVRRRKQFKRWAPHWKTPSPDYEHDLEAMLNAITPKTRIIFIANPNNPTGTLISQIKIDKFISRLPENIVTVFDEAYFEFLEN